MDRHSLEERSSSPLTLKSALNICITNGSVLLETSGSITPISFLGDMMVAACADCQYQFSVKNKERDWFCLLDASNQSIVAVDSVAEIS